MDYPEQLRRKDGDEEQEEDVLPVALSQANRPFSMNQSIFGLIAAAGSKVDFQDRFEEHSSDDEAAENQSDDEQDTTDPMAQTTILHQAEATSRKGHRRKFSDGKLMKSVPILSRLSSKKSRSNKKEGKKPVSQIQGESEPGSPAAAADAPPLSPENRETLAAPVMSRMVEARAEASARPSFDQERDSIDKARDGLDSAPSKLSQRLQRIFEFNEPENIVSGLSLLPLQMPPD